MPFQDSVLWRILETHAYTGMDSLVENILILMYVKWLDQNSHALISQKNRWQVWTSLPEHLRFAYFKDRLYPLLQSHAPMSGHLLGLILPTLAFGVPSAHALSELIEYLDTHSEETVLNHLVHFLGHHPLDSACWNEIFGRVGTQRGTVLWEPKCQIADFLCAGARFQSVNHGFESAQGSCLWGRVQDRCHALLSAFRLLCIGQFAPHLDAYSLPRPRPHVIWTRAADSLAYPSLLDILAPGGKLLIWHEHAHRHTLKIGSGGLEVMQKQRVWQIREKSSTYQCLPLFKSRDVNESRIEEQSLIQ